MYSMTFRDNQIHVVPAGSVIIQRYLIIQGQVSVYFDDCVQLSLKNDIHPTEENLFLKTMKLVSCSKCGCGILHMMTSGSICALFNYFKDLL